MEVDGLSHRDGDFRDSFVVESSWLLNFDLKLPSRHQSCITHNHPHTKITCNERFKLWFEHLILKSNIPTKSLEKVWIFLSYDVSWKLDFPPTTLRSYIRNFHVFPNFRFNVNYNLASNLFNIVGTAKSARMFQSKSFTISHPLSSSARTCLHKDSTYKTSPRSRLSPQMQMELAADNFPLIIRVLTSHCCEI